MKENESEQSNVRYIISGSNGKNYGKTVLLAVLAIIGGVIGGMVPGFLQKATNDQNVVSNGGGNTTNVVKTYSIESVENPVVAIADKVIESVVYIKTTYTTTVQSIFGPTETESGAEGSGVIYSSDGYIVTNCHLIQSAVNNEFAKTTVTLSDGTEYDAKIVGYDAVTDIAVLKIDATNLVKAEFGSSGELKVGELCVAIGSPMGKEFASTVTVGYISGINRSVEVEANTYNLLQTDAAINSGNSGGPLVNAAGLVIGINTAKVAATGVEGIGFSLPIDDVLPIVEELIANKKIERPYIGIAGISITTDMAKRYNLVEGIYIQSVENETPAYLAGLKQGDVITEANGTKVASINELNVIKNKMKVGDEITLKIYRAKDYIDIKIVLGSGK